METMMELWCLCLNFDNEQICQILQELNFTIDR